MASPVSPRKSTQDALAHLRRRARDIIESRPAYAEMVTFYLPLFCRQIEWRERAVVHPEPLSEGQVRACLADGTPLAQRFDPGLDAQTMLALWVEMKRAFRGGNKILADAMNQVESAECRGTLVPVPWLMEQRPDRAELVTETSRQIGVEETVISSLARAVTLPSWARVARDWLQNGRAGQWSLFYCPVCGGPPGIAEVCPVGAGQDGVTAATGRFLHCPFCAWRWQVPLLECPACASAKSGDARYLFSTLEPELRIDYCNSCRMYLKTILADKIGGLIHVGLEQLTTAHLDLLAQTQDLRPLEARFGHECGGRPS